MSIFNDLKEQLHQYSPSDTTQAKFKKQIQEYSFTRDILSSKHFTPGHITTSAAVLSPDQKQIALIFHPFLKLWLQPGGHIEKEDISVFDAAQREVFEEIHLSKLKNLSLNIFDLDIHSIPNNPKKNQPSHLHLDLRFLFHSPSWDLKPSSEIKQAEWVPLNQVQEIRTDHSVKRLISKIYQQIL